MKMPSWSAGVVLLILLGCESKPGSTAKDMKETPLFDGAAGDPKILEASKLQAADASLALKGFEPLKSPDGRYTAWLLKGQIPGVEACVFIDDATSKKRVRVVCPSLKSDPVEEASWISSQRLLIVQRRTELREYGLEGSGAPYRVRALADLPSEKFVYVLPFVLKGT